MAQSRPVLLSTSAKDETFAGVTYHVDGELVPALTVEIAPHHPVYFEHHIMLWKHPTVEIGIRAMKGALKRMVAGMQVFVTEASGQGQIAFSRDGARLVSASYDRSVKVWDTTSGELLHTLHSHTGNVECVAFSPDGRRLASGGEDRTVRLWETATGREV